MDHLDLTFSFENSTPNTVRFKEDTEADVKPIVGKLYVRKDVLAKMGDPKSITLRVTPTERK